MKVISKDLAYEVAKSITSDLWDSIQKERDVFNYMVESIVKNNTPDEIKKLSQNKLLKEYFTFSNNIEIEGTGFKSFYIYTEFAIVCNNRQDFQLDKKDSALIVKEKNRIEKREKEYKELREEIKTALLNLKTIKRIQQEMPIALKFIPQIFPVPSVIVNFANLSKKIEKITS